MKCQLQQISTMSKILDVYLSFSSPFSYLAQTQLAALAERTQCDIAYHVIGDDMYWGNDRLIFVEEALKR